MGGASSKDGGRKDGDGTEMEVETCSNCGKASPDEAPLQRCSACQSVHYCSKECQKKHWSEKHKTQCKDLAKAVPEWFPYPDQIFRLVKRTGLNRPFLFKMLDRYRRDGAFPGKDGDECEAYAMSAWVHDLREQVTALDDKLEGPQDAKSASTWGSWLGYGVKKPVLDESMEGLHQEWCKKGKSKGALHETFFDTEYLICEIALMREVVTKAASTTEVPVTDVDLGSLKDAVPDLSADDHQRLMSVMGNAGPDVAATVVLAMKKWDEECKEIPEELALDVCEKEHICIEPWQVRAIVLLLKLKRRSDAARRALRKAALFQLKEQKRAMDLCRAMPGKLVDAMTCTECCNGRVLLSKETREQIDKMCLKATRVPWRVGQQHLKMNEFLLSMDQVAEQLKELSENEYALNVQDSVHTELVACAHERALELAEEAWIACVNGAAGVLLPGEDLPGLDEREDKDEGSEEDSDSEEDERSKQHTMTMRLVEAYRTSTKMRVASDAYDQDESLQEALANFGQSAPKGKFIDSDESDSD